MAATNIIDIFRRMLLWLAPPAVIDFWLAQFRINYRWQTPTARVVSLTRMADDVLQLVLKPGRQFSAFKPGQHICVLGVVDGMMLERSYSIANQPNDRHLIELSIKLQGQFSHWLASQVGVGDVLEISQPWGQSYKQLHDVYIAGGIGITAILPLFQQAVEGRASNKSIRLIYLANENQDWLYRENLDALQGEHVDIIYHDGRKALQDGRFFEGLIAENDSVISCGSESFNNQLACSFANKDIQLQVESFNHLEPETVSGEKKTITISLTQSGRTVTGDSHTNVLQTLIDAGIDVKRGCRQGICHQCSCQLNSGDILQHDKLRSQSAIEQNKISMQPCIAFAQSDIALNL